MLWCFPPERFPEAFEEGYERLEELGRGGYSVVYRVKKKTGERSGEIFAAKVVDVEKFSLKSAREEIETLQSFRDIDNVVRYVEHFEDEECHKVVIIMTVARGDNLFSIACNQKLSEDLAKEITRQLLVIIRQCQDELQIVNGDLKLENLLVDLANPSSPVVTLIDLGSVQKAGKPVKGYTGSYVAPEAMGTNATAEFPADMFSVGIFIYKILARGAAVKWAFPGPKIDLSLLSASDSAKELIKALATYDVKARLTVTDALAHPWICGMDTGDIDIQM